MTRKHSYRTLAKRNFAALVLAVLEGEEIYSDGSEKGKAKIEWAIKVADELKAQGSRANLHGYSPYKNQIRKIISKNIK